MEITTDAAVTAASTVGSVGLGWVLALASERRVKLIAHYGHVSAFPLKSPPVDGPHGINTHAVVVRNAGRKAATNVRISHHYLPSEFSLYPAIGYRTEEVPGSGPDIVIPLLIPGQQFTINYLYFSPMTFDNITSGVRSDEGFARVVDVLLTPQPKRWQLVTARGLTLMGAATVLYFAIISIRAALNR